MEYDYGLQTPLQAQRMLIRVIVVLQAVVMYTITIGWALRRPKEKHPYRFPRPLVLIALLGMAASIPAIIGSTSIDILADVAFQWMPVLGLGILIRVRYPGMIEEMQKGLLSAPPLSFLLISGGTGIALGVGALALGLWLKHWM